MTATANSLVALARETCSRAYSPCGACRQRIREFAVDGRLLVHFPWRGGALRAASIDELPPHAFELPAARSP